MGEILMDGSYAKLGRSSPLFFFVLIAALGIIFLRGRFLLAPLTGATAFGVPLVDGNGLAFAYTKGVRDIFSGLVGLPFLFAGRRRALAWILLTATIIAIADGLIMMKFSGFRSVFLSVHWGAALYMLVLTFFPFRSPGTRVKHMSPNN